VSSCSHEPTSELQSVACCMRSHNSTRNPTQVNVFHLHPSQTSRPVLDLPQRDGRLSWPWCWLNTAMVYLSTEVTRPSSNEAQRNATLLIDNW